MAKLHQFNTKLIKLFVEEGIDAVRNELDKSTDQVLVISKGYIQKSMELQAAYKEVKDITVNAPTGRGFTPPSLLREQVRSLRGFTQEFEQATIEQRQATRKQTGGKRFTKLATDTFNELAETAKRLKGSEEGYGYIEVTGSYIAITGSFRQIQKIKQELTEEAERYLQKNAAAFLRSTTIGHSEAISAIVARQSKLLFDSLTFASARDFKTFRFLTNAIIKIEGDTTLSENILSKVGVNYELAHTLEFSFNLGRGSKTGGFSEELRGRLATALQRSLNRNIPQLDKYLEELVDIKFSPTFTDYLSEQIEQVFLEKRIRSRKILKTTKKSTTKKLTSTKRPSATTLKIEGIKGKRERGQAPSLLDNLTSLKNIINANIHDKLRDEVMGKGGAHELLNYRTGRFAHSAQVTNLGITSSGKSLIADITWQHNPYDVFLPGHRLYRPLRDPNLLIGRAVRAILRDIGLQRISRTTRTRVD